MKHKMSKKAKFVLLASPLVLMSALASYFFTTSETSKITKKTFFSVDLSTSMKDVEVGPGNSFTCKPVVYNDATLDMYVFVVVTQLTLNNASIYTYDVDDSWTSVSTGGDKQIYAYASEDTMTALTPGESTTELTSKMTMISMTHAQYYQISDINVTITAYAIGTESVSTDIQEAWASCKSLGNIE